MNDMKKLICVIFGLMLSFHTLAASFDCSKAASYVEIEICKDELLGRLDDALHENYISMMASNFGGTEKSLMLEQRRWLKIRNSCKSKKCIESSYRLRLNETCEYGVISGVHPLCTMGDELK